LLNQDGLIYTHRDKIRIMDHRKLHSKVMAAPCRTTDDGSSFILSKAP